MFLVLYIRNTCLTQGHKDFLLFCWFVFWKFYSFRFYILVYEVYIFIVLQIYHLCFSYKYSFLLSFH